jgi:hypothetical protein
MSRKMTPEEIRAFLSHGTRTAKLATSGPDGQPHVMPVWFALDGEELVFTTWGDSVKGRNLRRNPRGDSRGRGGRAVCVRAHSWSCDAERGPRGAAALRDVDRRPVHGRRPSRGVRPPKRRAGRAAGAAPSGACAPQRTSVTERRTPSGARLARARQALRCPSSVSTHSRTRVRAVDAGGRCVDTQAASPPPPLRTETARKRATQRSPLTDSNRRPPPYHGGALPAELRGRFGYSRRFPWLAGAFR